MVLGRLDTGRAGGGGGGGGGGSKGSGGGNVVTAVLAAASGLSGLVFLSSRLGRKNSTSSSSSTSTTVSTTSTSTNSTGTSDNSSPANNASNHDSSIKQTIPATDTSADTSIIPTHADTKTKGSNVNVSDPMDAKSSSQKSSDIVVNATTPMPPIVKPQPTKVLRVNGLCNLGNTCFMNAVLQSLASTRPFVRYLSTIVSAQTSAGMLDIPFTQSLWRCIDQLSGFAVDASTVPSTSRSNAVNPSAFERQLRQATTQFRRLGEQQDSDEFYHVLLDVIEKELSAQESKLLKRRGSRVAMAGLCSILEEESSEDEDEDEEERQEEEQGGDEETKATTVVASVVRTRLMRVGFRSKNPSCEKQRNKKPERRPAMFVVGGTNEPVALKSNKITKRSLLKKRCSGRNNSVGDDTSNTGNKKNNVESQATITTQTANTEKKKDTEKEDETNNINASCSGSGSAASMSITSRNKEAKEDEPEAEHSNAAETEAATTTAATTAENLHNPVVTVATPIRSAIESLQQQQQPTAGIVISSALPSPRSHSKRHGMQGRLASDGVSFVSKSTASLSSSSSSSSSSSYSSPSAGLPEVTNPMEGTFLSQVVCERCRSKSPLTSSNYAVLSLSMVAWPTATQQTTTTMPTGMAYNQPRQQQVPQPQVMSTLSQCLTQFTAVEVIEDVECACCKLIDGKNRQRARKRLILGRMPQVLCVHLQRRQFDMQRNRTVKLNQHVECPLVFDLYEFCFSSSFANQPDTLPNPSHHASSTSTGAGALASSTSPLSAFGWAAATSTSDQSLMGRLNSNLINNNNSNRRISFPRSPSLGPLEIASLSSSASASSFLSSSASTSPPQEPPSIRAFASAAASPTPSPFKHSSSEFDSPSLTPRKHRSNTAVLLSSSFAGLSSLPSSTCSSPNKEENEREGDNNLRLPAPAMNSYDVPTVTSARTADDTNVVICAAASDAVNAAVASSSSSSSSSSTTPRDRRRSLTVGPVAVRRKEILYKMVAVVVHHGGAEGGHFTAYRRVVTDDLADEDDRKCVKSSQQWVHISDSAVRAASLEEVLHAPAYMVFYERML